MKKYKKKHICTIIVSVALMLTLTACKKVAQNEVTQNESSQSETEENNMNDIVEDGGKVDNSQEAPKEIISKNIDSFSTSFYLINEEDPNLSGGYSFSIKQDENGKYILSEDMRYKISVETDKSILDSVQAIIEENDLIKLNGMESYTSGLPEEYAPCEFRAIYDSGEQLYFFVDNNPEAKWASSLKELFFGEFKSKGHDDIE